MRLHSVIVALVFSGIIAVSLHDYAWCASKLGGEARRCRNACTSKRFIAESFKNTCRGKGFSSLEEWQLCCRQMFKLEYIAWCDSKEFMTDDCEDGPLFYGKWITSDNTSEAGGEVYCRIREAGHAQ